MSSFEDRKKNFENKFAHDEELKFCLLYTSDAADE